MSRFVILAGVLTATAAHAETPPDASQQLIGGSIGLASGGRETPGGLRIDGHYQYQLSDRDFFDGTAGFTYGGGSAACFRDRGDSLVCDHGLLDGAGVEITAAVRRYWPAQGKFQPFARVGVGVQLVHYSGDSLSGFLIPIHVGGGVRAAVAPGISIVGIADLTGGVGVFGRGLGGEPELGLAVTVGVEFGLP